MKPDWEKIAFWSDVVVTGILALALYIYICFRIKGYVTIEDLYYSIAFGMLFVCFWVTKIGAGVFIAAYFGIRFILRKLSVLGKIFLKRKMSSFLSPGIALCRKLSLEERNGKYLDFACFGESGPYIKKRSGGYWWFIDFMEGGE